MKANQYRKPRLHALYRRKRGAPKGTRWERVCDVDGHELPAYRIDVASRVYMDFLLNAYLHAACEGSANVLAASGYAVPLPRGYTFELRPVPRGERK